MDSKHNVSVKEIDKTPTYRKAESIREKLDYYDSLIKKVKAREKRKAQDIFLLKILE